MKLTIFFTAGKQCTGGFICSVIVLFCFYILPKKKKTFILGPFKCNCVRFHLSFKYFTIFLFSYFLIQSYIPASHDHKHFSDALEQSNKIKQNNARLA